MTEGRRNTPDERLSRLEAESFSTRQDVEKLATAFDRFATDVRDWMRTSKQTDWKVVLSGIGLVLVVGGLWLQPVKEDVQMNSSIILKMQEYDTMIAATRWTRSDDKTRMTEYDADLVRRLQALEESLGKSIEHNADSLEWRGEWIREHERDVSKINAEQYERIEALQRDFDRLLQDFKDSERLLFENNVEGSAKDAELLSRVADLENEVREISAEQRRRTEKVYQ